MDKKLFEFTDEEIEAMSDEQVQRLVHDWIARMEEQSKRWEEERKKERENYKAISNDILEGKHFGIAPNGIAWHLEFPYYVEEA